MPVYLGDGSLTKEPDEIERQRDWIEENREEYERAMEILRDPTRARALLQSFSDKLQEVMRYNPLTDPPHAAVALVAKTQERMSGVFEDLDFLEEFEQRREAYLARVQGGRHADLDN